MPANPPWRILAVDDEEGVLAPLKEFLEDEEVDEVGSKPKVDTTMNFEHALGLLEATRYDLLILDVRVGPDDAGDAEVGVHTLEHVQARRFLPVIFNTAIPNAVRHLESPLIRVVEKTEGQGALLQQVRELFATQLPEVNRALIEHVEAVQRRYMWDFVAQHWGAFSETGDRAGLALLLARRLALSLSGTGIDDLATRLGYAGPAPAGGHVEPMRYYVLPPVEAAPLVGDIYRGQIAEVDGYWMLMTPSCDLAAPVKAEFVLLARCLLLKDQAEYKAWVEKLPAPTASIKGQLKGLLQNNRAKTQPERFFFLPAALTIPGLVADFQQITRLDHGGLDGIARIASLDSPFAEAMVARFVRYFGRLGTPDLNVDGIMARLEAETAAAAPAP